MKTFLKVLAVCATAVVSFMLFLCYTLGEDATFADETGRYD